MLIHKTVLQSLRHAISKDVTRPILQRVRVEDDGSVVAADGHLLLYHTSTSQDAKDYPTDPPNARRPVNPNQSAQGTIPIAMIDRAVKATPKRAFLPILENICVSGTAPVRVVATDLDCAMVDVDCDSDNDRYPNWRSVPPDGEPVFTVPMSAELLIAIGKAAQAGGGPKHTRGVIVTFTFTKAKGVGQDAVGLSFEGQVGTIRGVVMPART